MRAAHELLVAPTIDGGSSQPGSGGRGSQRSQNRLPSRPECIKRCQNSQFHILLDFKIGKNAIFHLKEYTPDFFLRNILIFKIFCYFRSCGVMPVQSFGSHICPQPRGLDLKPQQTKNDTRGICQFLVPKSSSRIVFVSLNDNCLAHRLVLRILSMSEKMFGYICERFISNCLAT